MLRHELLNVDENIDWHGRVGVSASVSTVK